MACCWFSHKSSPEPMAIKILVHYGDVMMGAIASQITSLTIVYSTVYSDADQRKHQSSALLAFVRGIHRGPVNSPHKWPVTRKICPYDDVIMRVCQRGLLEYRYPSETHLKSCNIWLVQIIHFGFQILLKVCTEHDSDTVVLCVKIQNDVRTE